MTWFLDLIRYSIVVAGTAIVLYMFGTRGHERLAVLLAIPIFVSLIYLVNLSMLPFYFSTREHKAVSRILKAIGDDDFCTALRFLRAYEKQDVVEKSGQNTATSEIGEAKVPEKMNSLEENQVAACEKTTNPDFPSSA
jgi:hypothetical protein